MRTDGQFTPLIRPPKASLVTALYRGEGPVGVMAAHPGLGADLLNWYLQTVQETQTAGASGALLVALKDLRTPSIASLSQLVAAWAKQGGHDFVFPLSPIFESVDTLNRIGTSQVSLDKFLGPESPWFVRRFGDNAYAFGDRLDFVDQPLQLPLAAIVAAISASEHLDRPPMRPGGLQNVRYIIQSRVGSAFVSALSADDQLWPLDRAPDSLYYGLHLADLSRQAIPLAVWRLVSSKGFVPLDSPEKSTHLPQRRIRLSELPASDWERLRGAFFASPEALDAANPRLDGLWRRQDVFWATYRPTDSGSFGQHSFSWAPSQDRNFMIYFRRLFGAVDEDWQYRR